MSLTDCIILLERLSWSKNPHSQHINCLVKGPNSLFISCSEDTKIGISNGQLIDYHSTSLRALFYDEFSNILVSGGGKESLSFHKYCTQSDVFHLISDQREGFMYLTPIDIESYLLAISYCHPICNLSKKENG